MHQHRSTHRASLGALLGGSLLLGLGLAPAPAAAELVYGFVCTSVLGNPPAGCSDVPAAGFTATFRFDASSPDDVKGQTITAADPRFLGWTATSLVPPAGFNLSGNDFLGQSDLSDLQFIFSADGKRISGLNDLDGDAFQFGDSPAGDQQVIVNEGLNFTYYVARQYDDSIFGCNCVDPYHRVIFGQFVLPGTPVGLADVPEPGTMALFSAGLLGLGMLRRRNDRLTRSAIRRS